MTTTRLDVDAAIERWLRALARAGGMRSTSALIAQAQTYGCPMWGGRCEGAQLVGLVAAEGVVRECTPLERRVLMLRYAGAVSVATERDGTGVAVQTGTRMLSHGEIGAALGLTADVVERVITEARAKIRAAL